MKNETPKLKPEIESDDFDLLDSFGELKLDADDLFDVDLEDHLEEEDDLCSDDVMDYPEMLIYDIEISGSMGEE
jgi:hypothetical protein